MREELLGYLLGALDAAERQKVETRLQSDPDLRSQLESMRVQLEPLDDEPCQPPPGLAARTCDLIEDFEAARPSLVAPRQASAPQADQPVAPRKHKHAAARMSLASEFTAGNGWRMADMIVAAGIFLAASLLFFPAIVNSRFTSQVQRCQENMQQIGLALQQYADFHGGLFPAVESDRSYSVAGIYAPLLFDNGYVRQPERFICPSATDVELLVSWQPPSLEQLQSSDPEEIEILTRYMGGTYGYQLGYVDGRDYQTPQNRSRANFPIMADMPGASADLQSANHGGRGQNVLYEDAHVEFSTQVRTVGLRDDFFRSDRGIVEPGRHANDAVIGGSRVRTLPLRRLD